MYRILFYNFNPRSVNTAHLGFEEIGCPVMKYDMKNSNLNVELMEKNLNNLIDSFKPDIIFSYGWWIDRINIDAFCNVIKRRGIFHVFWAFDDPECFNKLSLPIGKHCDLVFTSVVECIEDYENNEINAFLLLHGCHPSIHKKVSPSQEFAHDIVLLANNYNAKQNPNYFAYRFNGIKNVVRPIVENNYDLMVWGLWWRDSDRIYNLPKKKL